MEGVVVSAAEGAVRSLLGKLGKLLAQNAVLLLGLRKEIQFMKDELESMDAFLRNLAKKEDHDDQIMVWMKQVREMAYDTEDCVDKFMHHLGKPCGHGFKGLLRRGTRFVATLDARIRIANNIQILKARAIYVSERRSRYGVVGVRTAGSTTSSGATSGYPQFDHRLPSLFVEESQLVGFEEPRKKIVNWLTEASVSEFRVVSIHGFGGLGKTTLASIACQSPEVMAHFKYQAFVVVSQTFETKNILMKILDKVAKPSDQTTSSAKPPGEGVATPRANEVDRGSPPDLTDMETWNLMELGSKLKEHLQDKRYVIVLDDIWNVSAWESIRFALPDNSNKGSRILVTTRIETVAKTCCSPHYDHIHEMEHLLPDKSEELFFKRVFGSADSNVCPPELKEVSGDILKKCGGLPLAIISIGSLLASKNKMKEEWEKVHARLGSELETSPTLEGMKKILMLSYNDLPYHLKACFLYLSIFPEDYEIQKTMLQRRWVAEGFVSGRRGLSVEDVAESYFNELISRNVVQPVNTGRSGKVQSVKVHDMMLEVIVSKSIEENFVTLLGEHFSVVTHDRVRRLSVHGGMDQEQASAAAKEMSLSHVRSLTMISSAQTLPLLPPDLPKVLRVLDLTSCRDLQENQLKRICKLFQLKYLGLRETRVENLPEEIGKLQNLETLDIRDTHITELPTGVVKLQHLKHLLSGPQGQWASEHVQIPCGVGKMKALQTLYKVKFASRSAMEELGKLTNLRKLYVETDSNTEKGIVPALKELSSCLRSLEISTSGNAVSLECLNSLSSPPLLLRRLKLHGSLSKLPGWVAKLSNVTKITLESTKLPAEEDAIQALEKLPSLQSLSLLQHSAVKNSLTLGPEGFPNLKFLEVANSDISIMRFKKGTAPNLENFIWDRSAGEPVDNISSRIDGIQHLPRIKEVKLFRVCTMDALKAVADHPNHPRFIVY